MTALTRSLRWVESEVIGYRRVWRGTVFSSFISPVLFLSAMGLGLGTLVDSGSEDLGVPYLAFVATGLLAATAMQTSAAEGAFPVMACGVMMTPPGWWSCRFSACSPAPGRRPPAFGSRP